MSQVEYPDDPGLVVVLKTFGVAADRLLGHGGEAWVYALDAAQVLRVLHAHGTPNASAFANAWSMN